MKRQSAIFLILAVTSIIAPVLLPYRVSRLLPLLGSLINLQWCFDEYFLLAPFTSRESQDVNARLGRYYTAWQESLGPAPAAVSFPLTMSSSVVTLVRLYSSGSPAPLIGYYCGGLLLTIIHIPFGGKAFGLLETIKKGKQSSTNGEPSSLEALNSWLAMHGRRIWVVDIPAVIMFFVATVQVTTGA